jgi:DNA-binding HxlR family transcriptional regulator
MRTARFLTTFSSLRSDTCFSQVTLLVIRDLMFKGRTTYGDFLRAEEGIATNILADRLSRLEGDGVIVKDSGNRANAPRYRLTTKGIDLLPIMVEIIGWSAKHDLKTAADRTFVRRLKSDRAGLLSEIRAELEARLRKKRPRPKEVSS